MIKQILLFLLFVNFNIFCSAQDIEFNLDFENLDGKVPKGLLFTENKDCNVIADSINVYSGKYSVMTEIINSTTKGWLYYMLQDVYEGKKLKLSGYIKTENVVGNVGLFIQMGNTSFGKSKDALTGTNDWTKLEVEGTIKPFTSEYILIGGVLSGSGKVWYDNFNITIDGKDIKEIEPYFSKELPADLDTEFEEGSNIYEIELNDKKIENLKLLGLIWGFVKYYHPNVSKGNYNLDYELFRILPEFVKAENNQQRDSILVQWINSLGAFEVNINDNSIEYKNVKLYPDLDWIYEYDISPELRNILLEINNSEKTLLRYYVKSEKGNCEPLFLKDSLYENMSYSDSGLKLLALYRYWNIVQYFFPYKYLIGEDWKDVLPEFIPKFINSNDMMEYHLTILELITRINDSHAAIYVYMDSYFGNRILPVEITFIENKAVVTDFYRKELDNENIIQKGDIINKINGILVDSIINKYLKITPASNYPVKLRGIAPKLLQTHDSIIDIELIRDNKKYRKIFDTYELKDIHIPNKYKKADTCYMQIDSDIAYLYLGSIKRDYIPEIWKNIKDTKGLIIDLRCYPLEYVLDFLGEYLVPEDAEYIKYTVCNISTPGMFTFFESRITVNKKTEETYKGKIVILVNEMTQSQAEATAMAFRTAQNALIIGSTTSGADGRITFINLPGNVRTTITGLGVYYPDYSETQRVGVKVDIEIKPTIEGIKNGRDELLEKAIELIKN